MNKSIGAARPTAGISGGPGAVFLFVRESPFPHDYNAGSLAGGGRGFCRLNAKTKQNNTLNQAGNKARLFYSPLSPGQHKLSRGEPPAKGGHEGNDRYKKIICAGGKGGENNGETFKKKKPVKNIREFYRIYGTEFRKDYL